MVVIDDEYFWAPAVILIHSLDHAALRLMAERVLPILEDLDDLCGLLALDLLGGNVVLTAFKTTSF